MTHTKAYRHRLRQEKAKNPKVKKPKTHQHLTTSLIISIEKKKIEEAYPQ
jgi:hypothetical protein